VSGTASGALRAEWTKLRTIPGTIWLLLTAVVVTGAVSAAAVASTTYRSGAVGQVDPAKLSLTGIDVGQAVVAILAVLAVGTVGVLASVLAGRLILPGHGFTPAHGYELVSLAHGPVLRAAAGSVLYLALVALLSLGAAAVVREQAQAIGAVLGLLYLFPIVAGAVSDPAWQRHLQQIGPMTAGLAIQATVDVRSLPLSPWAGLGVLAAWAAGALLAGALVLRWRDA
jgi:ABC-2 type transport system permease protein